MSTSDRGDGRNGHGRFAKGAPSANPNGRPRKISMGSSLLRDADPTTHMLATMANQIVGSRADGGTVSRLEHMILEMYQIGRETQNTKLLLGVAKLLLEASDRYNALKITHIETATQYKEVWTPKFREAAARKRPPPHQFPHPDDIVFDQDGNVLIVGPTNEHDAALLRKGVAYRDELRDILLDMSLRRFNGRGKSEFRTIERQYIKMDRMLPRRMRRPLPAHLPINAEEAEVAFTSFGLASEDLSWMIAKDGSILISDLKPMSKASPQADLAGFLMWTKKERVKITFETENPED